MGEMGQLIIFSERVRQLIISLEDIQIILRDSSISNKNNYNDFLVTVQCSLMDLYEAVLSQLEEMENG